MYAHTHNLYIVHLLSCRGHALHSLWTLTALGLKSPRESRGGPGSPWIPRPARGCPGSSMEVEEAPGRPREEAYFGEPEAYFGEPEL